VSRTSTPFPAADPSCELWLTGGQLCLVPSLVKQHPNPQNHFLHQRLPAQAGCRQQDTASKAGSQPGGEGTAAFGGCVDVPAACHEASTPPVEAANSSHGESPVLSALSPWESRVASVPRWKIFHPTTWCLLARGSARAPSSLPVPAVGYSLSPDGHQHAPQSPVRV